MTYADIATRAPTAADIAGRLALKRYPRSWRGDCPACGYSRVFCVKQGRNGMPLLYCANGCDRDALRDTVQSVFGTAWEPPVKPTEREVAEARQAKQAAALRLWAGSERVPGTLAERYLQHRGIGQLAASAALRFRADCTHPEQPGRHPALIALVQDAAANPIAVHRTYLDQATGRKVTFEPQKASLGSVWGGAIRLMPYRPGMPLVIGEGIESSASAGVMTGSPAWAAISAANLATGLLLPPDVTSVAIAADPGTVGENAARAAALRFAGEGRQVQILRPDGSGDFNDVLCAAGGIHAG